jgi:flagellin
MVINTNTTAQSSARLLSESSSMLSKSLARLSSGSKITSPEDDAAGLAVSLRFDAQVNRISAASSNVGNAISFSQTQDGFLQKVGKALDRMSELAVLAQDGTKTSADDTLYNKEFTKLKSYISDITGKQFNAVNLFTTGSGMGVTTDPESATLTALTGVNLSSIYDSVSTASVSSTTSAATALSAVTGAIRSLASARADVGANISTLNSYSAQLGVLKDNLSAANSRIKDVDVAEESTAYARANILVQAGTAMLAQANTAPQAALKLLG